MMDSPTPLPRAWGGTPSGCGTSRSRTAPGATASSRSTGRATPCIPAGGGIGQGLALAIGAAVAAPGRKVVCLTGDGGLALNLGELMTAAEVGADLALVVMNDRGYGVIRNIQDAEYGGRRRFVDLATPDFAALSAACGLDYRRISAPCEFTPGIRDALARPGPALIEIDMTAIGPPRVPFGGPMGGRS